MYRGNSHPLFRCWAKRAPPVQMLLHNLVKQALSTLKGIARHMSMYASRKVAFALRLLFGRAVSDTI